MCVFPYPYCSITYFQVWFANEFVSVICQTPINWNFLLENPQVLKTFMKYIFLKTFLLCDSSCVFGIWSKMTHKSQKFRNIAMQKNSGSFQT